MALELAAEERPRDLLAGRNILIVEDHAFKAKSLTNLIEAQGGLPIVAVNISAALDIPRRLKHPIDLAIIDNDLPAMSSNHMKVLEYMQNLREIVAKLKKPESFDRSLLYLQYHMTLGRIGNLTFHTDGHKLIERWALMGRFPMLVMATIPEEFYCYSVKSRIDWLNQSSKFPLSLLRKPIPGEEFIKHCTQILD